MSELAFAGGRVMFQDLLVPMTHARSDGAVLSFGVALAEAHEAHLAVLIVVPLLLPIGFEMEAVPPDLYERLHDAERARAAKLAGEVRDRLQASGASWEVRTVESYNLPASSVAALHARHSDVVIVAGDSGEDGRAAELFVSLLQASGRPVLVVPPQHDGRVPQRRATVAWQPTREAARAVHDALPLLRAVEQIDVLVVEPRIDASHHGEAPGSDLATHLARHELAVEVVVTPKLGESVDQALLRFVVESGAELVVAGGYSHSRWREQVLGGATRTLFEQSPVPVLFSH